MGTLASELGPHAERLTEQTRVYVDANVPAGLVAFMRGILHWDALFASCRSWATSASRL